MMEIVRPIALATTVGVACLLASRAAVAQTTDEELNRAVVGRSFDAWAAGTGSPYDLLAENVTWTITGHSLASKTYGSREAFIGEVIRPFNARMSVGLKPTIRRMYADGDTVIVFFDASGTAKDGIPYANTYAWFPSCAMEGSPTRRPSSTASRSTISGRG